MLPGSSTVSQSHCISVSLHFINDHPCQKGSAEHQFTKGGVWSLAGQILSDFSRILVFKSVVSRNKWLGNKLGFKAWQYILGYMKEHNFASLPILIVSLKALRIVLGISLPPWWPLVCVLEWSFQFYNCSRFQLNACLYCFASILMLLCIRRTQSASWCF